MPTRNHTAPAASKRLRPETSQAAQNTMALLADRFDSETFARWVGPTLMGIPGAQS
jgi:hypothetical protein